MNTARVSSTPPTATAGVNEASHRQEQASLAVSGNIGCGANGWPRGTLDYGNMKPVVAKVRRENARGNHRGTTRIMSAIFIPVSNHADSIPTSEVIHK